MATGRKNGNGEGSIYKRASDGKWVTSVTPPDGKRKVFYGKTRAEAFGKLQAAQKSIADGMPLPKERVTVAVFLEGWLKDTVPHRVRPKTAHRYREIVNLHLVPRLGRARLGRLGPSEVEKALNAALESGQSPKSVVQHRAVLRSALAVAVRDGLVGRNVAALARPPHVPEKEYDAVTPTSARAILGSVQGNRLEALYVVLLAAGLRAGEALGLRWDDVDLDAGALSIRRTLQRLEGQWQFMEPKTKRSRRTVPIPAAVVRALREHRARQAEERLRLGAGWDGERWENLTFTNEQGGPLDGSTVLHQFQRMLKRAGLPKMRIHDLRHGAASLMAALGVPPRSAMELLGHSQIAVTMNIYTHVAPEYQREAMNLVGDGIWGEAASGT